MACSLAVRVLPWEMGVQSSQTKEGHGPEAPRSQLNTLTIGLFCLSFGWGEGAYIEGKEVRHTLSILTGACLIGEKGRETSIL